MENSGLTITRVFDAPVEEVWKYWAEPEYFKRWWGPKDFTCPVANIDFRVGGKSHTVMHGPKGSEFDKDIWGIGTYKEIVPNRKIVVTDSFADEKGNIVSPKYYGMKGFPRKMLITVHFEEIEDPEQGRRTKMTLTHSGIVSISETDHNNMEQGWNQSFNKLNEVLQTTS